MYRSMDTKQTGLSYEENISSLGCHDFTINIKGFMYEELVIQWS